MGAVQKYNDVPLMKQVFELQSALLDLQQEIADLRSELQSANGKLKNRESVTKKGQYFYKAGDPDPLCPVCWSKDEKTIYLPASEHWGGGIRRDCHVCHTAFWDKPMPNPNEQADDPFGYQP